MVFEGTAEWMNLFIVSISNEQERKRNMRNIFCLRSNLSNDNITSV